MIVLRLRYSTLLCALCVLCGEQLLAAEPVVLPIDGKTFAAELFGVAADGSLRFQTEKEGGAVIEAGSPVNLRIDDLVRWGHPALPRAQPLVLLDDGSRLVTAADWSGGSAVQVGGDDVVVRSDVWEEVRVPRSSVVGLVFALRDHWQDRQKLEEAVRREASGKDVVLLTNQDRVSGSITKLAGGSLTINVDERETKLPLSRVAGVVFAGVKDAGGSARPRPQPPALIVGMRDGSLLVADAIRANGDGIDVKLANGATLTGGAIDDVVFLQGLDGKKFEYLSDLEAADYRHVPYLSIAWPYRRDRNVLGGSLTVGGQRYLKGIGMHSAARLTYRLDGKYRRFEAAAALDDSSEGRGSVKFGVYLLRDGEWKQAAVSDTIRGGDQPENVSVDVTGADGMTLTVDFEDRGDELDHADWLDARLIKN